MTGAVASLEQGMLGRKEGGYDDAYRSWASGRVNTCGDAIQRQLQQSHRTRVEGEKRE